MIGLGVLLTALVVLSAALAERRGLLHPRAARPGRLTVAQALVALAVLALANAELVAALVQRPFILSGDLRSHAMIAREIALGHANDGWIDVYHGGFPVGPHYPSVGWLLSAALMRVGISPQGAVVIVGAGAVLLTNALVFRLSMRAGASFGAALTGAAVMSWMAPLTSFLGGAPAILVLGMLSQVVVMPFVLVYAYAVLFGRSERALVASAALVVLAHPQVAIGAMLLLLVASVLRGRRTSRRWLVGTFVQGVVGGAVFGPGLVSLRVPFGWPPMDRWRVRGHAAKQFLDWLAEGEVFDFARPPVVTTVIACSLVVLVLTLRRRESRTIVITSAAALGLAVCGDTLAGMGRLGAFALSFLQPLRVYALLPVVAAASVTLALGVVEAYVRGLGPLRPLHRRRLRAMAVALPSLLALGWIARVGVPSARTEWIARGEYLSAGPCGSRSPASFHMVELERHLERLSVGRLYYADGELRECAATTNLDFASRIPLGAPFAAGAHVGIVADAFNHVQVTKPGGAGRADVLGIGTVLHLAKDRLLPDDAWHEVARAGDIVVSERVAGSSYFGVGCVSEVWRGSDPALRAELFRAQNAMDPVLGTPSAFVALEFTGAPVATREKPPSDCDPSRGAILSSRRVAPGVYEADVRAEAPVELVLKETAYRTWRFELDGAPVPFRLVAPGFMAIHLPAGTHHVAARTTPDVAYWVGVWAALLGAAAFAWWVRRTRWLRARGP